MTVYVDKPQYRFRRMVMCHMIADSIDELLEMADRIGVDRRHFQATASTPHFDICKSKRALAVKAGAVEVDRDGLVAVIRRLRKESSRG